MARKHGYLSRRRTGAPACAGAAEAPRRYATHHREARMMSDDLALSDLMQCIRQRTPARLLLGRAGAAYLTKELLDLRRAHAEAKDAVLAECDFTKLGPEL